MAEGPYPGGTSGRRRNPFTVPERGCLPWDGAGLPTPPFLPAQTGAPPRSHLVVSAADAKALEEAAFSSAHAVVIDLGASGSPAAKRAIRQQAVEALKGLYWGTKRKAIRIHPLDTPDGYEDLVDMAGQALDDFDAVAIPRVRRAAELYSVEAVLTQAWRQRDRGVRQKIEAELEFLPPAHHDPVEAIASATPLLDALVLPFPGTSTFGDAIVPAYRREPGSGAQEVRRRWEAVLAAAQRRGIRLVAGPGPSAAADGDALRRHGCIAYSLGFSGQRCRSSREALLINKAFTAAAGAPAPLARWEAYVAGQAPSFPPVPCSRHGEGGGITLLPLLAE